VVETVNKWQEHHLADKGRRTVYAGDEFYLRAGRDFPPADDYEEYPQLENGVGMAALFLDTVNRFLADEEAVADIASYKDVRPAVNYSEHKRTGEERAGAIKVILATGTLASRIIRPLITDLANRFGLDLQLISINNDFFGHTVSVAGLVTGQDLQKQLKPLIAEQQSSGVETIVMIPDCMLKSDEDIFLDDMSLQDLSDGLGTRIAAVPEQAEGLINALGALASEV
ncbi:MAG: DUF512 domain-containing protein, partial [Clostridiaceae bacterium]|nr:DUF512 domain-containing protein [Clostridiaceae bacterium]